MLLKILVFQILLILLFHFANAQNHFNVGINLGPAVSITSFSKSFQNLKLRPAFPSRLDYHLGISTQYLFDNKFGLETGFNISTKHVFVKSDQNSARKNYAYLDSFSFPFLFINKVKYPKNPFRFINFHLGLTIEYQYFIKGSDDLEKWEKVSEFIPNITAGSSISLRQGSMGKVDLGIKFNYGLNPYYEYKLLDKSNNAELFFSPFTHHLKVEVTYFFLNLKKINKN